MLRTRFNETGSKEQLIITHKVQKLSSGSLTLSQIKILSKGLKFKPNLQRNLLEIEKGFKDFFKKISL